jgi:quinol monooxygenase YgiN
MIVVAAIIKVVDGKEEEFESEFRNLAIKVLKDPGAIAYGLNRHVQNPNQYFIYEKYADEEAFKYHGSTPHFKEFARNIRPFMAGPLEVNLYHEAL